MRESRCTNKYDKPNPPTTRQHRSTKILSCKKRTTIDRCKVRVQRLVKGRPWLHDDVPLLLALRNRITTIDSTTIGCTRRCAPIRGSAPSAPGWWMLLLCCGWTILLCCNWLRWCPRRSPSWWYRRTLHRWRWLCWQQPPLFFVPTRDQV